MQNLYTRNCVYMLTIFFLFSCSNHKNNSKLKLLNAYEIETYNSIEPSGLTEWDGKFYTVSDKHNSIFQLTFTKDRVILKPVIEISNESSDSFDFEGITHDDDFFYIVSEKHFQILKISKDGKQQKWIPSSNQLQDAGKDVGLFQTKNAYFEGICLLNKHEFLLAVERQPRGFINYNSQTNEIKAYQKDEPFYEYKKGRNPDFSGLSCDGGIFVLDRNAHMVSELKEINGILQEVKGYSYDHVMNMSKYQYKDKSFGQAEGLVVKGDKIYLLLDNNKNEFSNKPGNNNALFFELQK